MKNGLLKMLSEADRKVIMPFLEPVNLQLKQVLFEAHHPIEYVYFFESGLSSEIATALGRGQLEVGCVGQEGLSGHAVLLGVDSTPHYAFMQAPGTALRITAGNLRRAMDESTTLRQMLLRFVHVFVMQLASTALSDARFVMRERLARWLLMCQDRVGNNMPLTHDFLALMLGVRRSGVTEMMHILEGERLVRAKRMSITVLDRPGLLKIAAGSYGVPELEYRRLIDPGHLMSGGVDLIRHETVPTSPLRDHRSSEHADT